MTYIRIIPCLDVNNGRVVKGVNFIDLADAGDPVEQAQLYYEGGADEICFLDITASHEKRKAMLEVIKKTTQNCFIPITVGGGVSNIEDINNLLLSGADKVSKKFGAQCIVVAVDAKKVSEKKWEIFTHGGRNKTGIDAIEYAKKAQGNGAGEILLTSMDKDGTKSGYDLKLLKQITSSLSIPVIASGGVGNLDHLYEGVKTGGASALLAASIFHFGELTIREVKDYLNSKRIPVRISNA